MIAWDSKKIQTGKKNGSNYLKKKKKLTARKVKLSEH